MMITIFVRENDFGKWYLSAKVPSTGFIVAKAVIVCGWWENYLIVLS